MLKGSNKSEMCSCFKVPTGVILKQFAKENLRDTKRACILNGMRYLTTHQSWDQSCHQLQSAYQGRLAHRSRPAPAPEGEVV